MTPASVDAAARLRAAGLRVTPARLAALDALSAHGGHPTVEQVAAAARERVGRLSTQAAYDLLHAFTAAGLARRIVPAGGPARFEARVGDNHHHLVCRLCGATRDVDCLGGSAPCLVPDATHGYALDEAEVTFWGTCPDCRTTDPTHPTERTT